MLHHLVIVYKMVASSGVKNYLDDLVEYMVLNMFECKFRDIYFVSLKCCYDLM